MIDTLVGSVWTIPFSHTDFEKDFQNHLNKKYRLERKSIPFYSAKEGGYAYQLLLKVISMESPKTYILIKLKPRLDLKGIPALKFKTELPLFKNAFWTEMRNLTSSSVWGFVLENHELSVLHAKCDFLSIKFDDFRISLDSNTSRNPCLLTNPETLRRTLYVSRNHYYYEKNLFVRGEIRLNGTKVIKSKLKIDNIFQLKDISFQNYSALFKGVRFIDPYSLKGSLSKSVYEDYRYFLKLLNDKSLRTSKTKRGEFYDSINFFIGAKRKLGKSFIRINQLLLLRSNQKIVFDSQLRKEYQHFNGGLYVQ